MYAIRSYYANVTLPIKKGGPKNEAWFYHCSFAQWPEHTVEDQAFYVKRFDLNHSGLIDRKTKRIDTSRGQYKAYHVNVYYRHAEYVEWYCIGVPEKLVQMLRFCTHIGKKTAQGWGSVKEWEVKEISIPVWCDWEKSLSTVSSTKSHSYNFV